MRINVKKINKVFESLNTKSQIDEFLRAREKKSEIINVVPFKFEPIGTVNTTEVGMLNSNFEINDFTSYAKLITGLNNIQVKWDGAYEVFIDEEANKDLPDIEKYITKNYQVGRVIKCFNYQESGGANTIPSPINAEFKQIELMETLTMKTIEKLDTDDLLKVYLIPQRDKWRWLYIPAGGLTEYYDKNNTYLGADVTFLSVNSIWSTSGGAIEQFIQKNAPGEGYAFPKWNADTKQIELDELRTVDIPIQAVQREYSGAATFNTIFCYGRPTIQETLEDGTIINKFNNKIKASRLLLPYQVLTPEISPINTKPSAETDYYLSIDANPTMNKYYENWKKQFEANYDLSLRAKFEGVLELEAEAELEKTNPIFEGTHQYILWDKDFTIEINKEFNTRTNKLTGDKITLNGNYSIAEILAHNAFISNHLITLPMNTQTNVTWKLQDIPLIGGFLNTITLGIPIGWTNTAARVQMGTLMLLTPANLVKYGNQLPGDRKDKSVVPFDLLQENKSDLIENSGIAGMGSAIKLLLTDEFEKNGVRYNTVQLGQKLDDGSVLLWDENCKPVAPTNTAGYVIDHLIDRSISKTDCRTVFFSSQFQAYQSTYKTKSKFTGEIRDWTNEIKFSSWNVDEGEIRWPQEIQQPTPPKVEAPLIEIPTKNKFIYLAFGADIFNKEITKPNGVFWYASGGRIWAGDKTNPAKLNKTYELGIRIADTYEYDYSKLVPNITQFAKLYKAIEFSVRNSGNYSVSFDEIKNKIVEVPIHTNISRAARYGSYYFQPIITGGGIAFNMKVASKTSGDIVIQIDGLTTPGKIVINVLNKNRKYTPVFDIDNKYEGFGDGAPIRDMKYPDPTQDSVEKWEPAIPAHANDVKTITQKDDQYTTGNIAREGGPRQSFRSRWESNIFFIPK